MKACLQPFPFSKHQTHGRQADRYFEAQSSTKKEVISINKTNPGVALVTGASTGIGYATARGLAERGLSRVRNQPSCRRPLRRHMSYLAFTLVKASDNISPLPPAILLDLDGTPPIEDVMRYLLRPFGDDRVLEAVEAYRRD
ncbi:hypothetical protein SAMN02927900_02201 [Rhizobium mongolense subsp. loessense]|uniref:Uncharacterized protein n=1 Tax=Rhizobium mongolense subsp. loessense TaxID=158890 RepID=A0A1G4R1P4_9HYPH|nr:hypothetical protein SAMN02927900_02201 [Rhizobium mongolense subsp. loessense]